MSSLNPTPDDSGGSDLSDDRPRTPEQIIERIMLTILGIIVLVILKESVEDIPAEMFNVITLGIGYFSAKVTTRK